MPSGSPARLRWQPPTFIPDNMADLRRFMAEQYRAIFNEFMNAQLARAVVPLIDSLIQAQSGQIIQGVADGQTIVLPAPVPGQLDDVRVVIDAVVNPVTVVDPNGNATILSTPGVFDFNAANAQPYGTPPAATALGGGTFVVEVADPTNLPAAYEATDSAEIDWTFSSGLVTLAIIDGSVALTRLANQAAETFLGNFGAAPGPPTARAGTSVAGAGLAYTAGGTLAVGSSTSIVVGADDVQRAALTGDVTAAQNSNATAFRSFTARSVLANATNAAGVPTELQGSAANHLLKVNAAGTALVFEALPLAAFPTIADDTFLANISGATAVPSAVALTTLAGAGLTGGADAILNIGAGTRITVNANDVQLAAGAAESFLGNFTAGSAVADYRAGSSVAGAGLTYAAGGTLNVGAGTGITANADDVAWNGLTVRVNTGANTGTRRRLNLIAGANVTITPADDAGNDEVDVTIASTDTNTTYSAGNGLTLTGTTFAVGAGTGITVGATTVAWNGVGGRANSGGSTFTRRRVNLIGGTNVTVGVADDSTNDEIDFTISATDTNTTYSAGNGLTLTGTTFAVGGSTSIIVGASDVQRAALTGDVTAAQNSNATTIANNAVTNAKLRDSAGFSVIGKATTGSGDPADITASDNTVLGKNPAGNLGFAQVQSGQIASGMRATQAAMEAASNTDAWVTPGRQQFHPSACKAWIIVDGDGVGIAAHYNTSSNTDNGIGDITVTYDTGFSSSEYAHLATTGTVAYNSGGNANTVNAVSRAGGSTRYNATNTATASTVADPDYYCFCAFGDQA